MRISPIGPIELIMPIEPITTIRRKKLQKARNIRSEIIRDENVGKDVDITICHCQFFEEKPKIKK
jgi:hypothetical protein